MKNREDFIDALAHTLLAQLGAVEHSIADEEYLEAEPANKSQL